MAGMMAHLCVVVLVHERVIRMGKGAPQQGWFPVRHLFVEQGSIEDAPLLVLLALSRSHTLVLN